MRLIFGPAMLLSIAGCATAGSPPQPSEPIERVRGEGGMCDAERGNTLIGQRASVDTGARALELTGAQVFRWAPPNSALTMDYRQDRVTVHYDEALEITRIACG